MCVSAHFACACVVLGVLGLRCLTLCMYDLMTLHGISVVLALHILCSSRA